MGAAKSTKGGTWRYTALGRKRARDRQYGISEHCKESEKVSDLIKASTSVPSRHNNHDTRKEEMRGAWR